MRQEMVDWRRGKELSQESRREKPKMQPEDLQARWNAQGEDIFAAVAQWRAAHPRATLAEIEYAVDEQMNRLRARMIEQAAQASAAAERTAVWTSRHASGEDVGSGGACLDSPSADAGSGAAHARGTEPASAAVEHVPRGE